MPKNYLIYEKNILIIANCFWDFVLSKWKRF